MNWVSLITYKQRNPSNSLVWFNFWFFSESPATIFPDVSYRDFGLFLTDISSLLCYLVPTMPNFVILFDSKFEKSQRVGLVLTSLKAAKITYALQFNFNTTNNDTAYKVTLVGLWLAKEMGIEPLKTFGDSMWVGNQIIGTYKAKETQIQQYLNVV